MKTHTTHTLSNKVSRLVGLFLVFGVLFSFTSTDVFAQVPPANTQIGNQASATYVDNGGNNQSITSNTVQTIVQQVAGVDISPGISLTASPGGQVTFPHTITNTGNGVDSYNLTTLIGSGDFSFDNVVIYADDDQNGVPDNFTPITVTPNIDPAGSSNGNTFGIVIVADIPVTASEGESQTFDITATSVFDSNISDSATNTVNVDEDAVINVQKNRDKQFVAVGDTVTYTFAYAESGGSSNAANLVIKDPLPAGVTYVPGSGVWSGAAGTPLTDASPGENATGILYEFDNTGSADSVIIEIANVNAGASGTVNFKVTVNAGTEGNTIVNNGTFRHDDSPTPVTTNNASIEVEENYDINRVGADTVSIASAEQGTIINFLNLFTNDGTATDTYNITLSGSNYPSASTFTYYKVDANNQPTSPYTDTNNDGTADTGPIAVGDTVKVILQVQLPSGESGGPYAVTKTLTSVGDPTESDFHTDALGEITTPTVDITNDFELGNGSETGAGVGPETSPVTTEAANPNSTVSFTLFINNTSSIDDDYDLTFATDTTAGGDLSGAGNAPSGWAVTFRDPNASNNTITSIQVDAGLSKEVTLEIDIPAGYQPGVVDFYIRALSQNTGAKDIKHDAVNVQIVRQMTLVSGQSGEVSPGGSVDYIHTLTINSNVDENVDAGGAYDESDLRVDLSNSVPTGWTAVVYWDTNNDGQVTSVDSLLTSAASPNEVAVPYFGALGYGDQIKFIVQVTASTGLNDGASVTTTLEVSDDLGQLATVTNDDQTGVQAGRLSIDKYQAPTIIGDTAGTYTKADFNVLPGDTVWYKITVVNDGSEPVTNVVIQDNVPSYTTIAVVGTYTVDNGSIPGITLDAGNPTVGNTGVVKITAPQLDPTEQFTLWFAVKVDE